MNAAMGWNAIPQDTEGVCQKTIAIQTCANGGTCTNSNQLRSGFICACTESFAGDRCELDVSTGQPTEPMDPCPFHKERCKDVGVGEENRFRCPEGYVCDFTKGPCGGRCGPKELLNDPGTFEDEAEEQGKRSKRSIGASGEDASEKEADYADYANEEESKEE